MNELVNMKTFVRVADSGSFSAASRELGVRQPTVSRRMAELEDSLRVPLLVRTTRSVELTDAGRRYLEQARVVLEQVELSRDAVRHAAALRGTLRIATVGSLASRLLIPELPNFLEAHPGVCVSLELSSRHVDLVTENIDVAIRVGGPVVATLAGRRLREVHRWFVASPSWVEHHGMPNGLSDLESTRGLVFSGTGDHLPGWKVDGEWIRPQRVVTSNAGEPLRDLALAGAGVALLPDWLVGCDLDAQTLVRLLPETAVPTLPLWIVWPQHRYQRAATRAFVDWAIEAVGAVPQCS